MTVDAFWERMGTAISNCGDCSICPVHEYAAKTNTNELCYEVGGCAGGLMMLHKKLQDGEQQKMDKERESNAD